MKQFQTFALIQKGGENVIRNWTTAVPTILVMAIVLTMFHGVLMVHEKAQNIVDAIQQKFSITIYLKDDADPFEVGKIITELEQRTDVTKPVSYTSKEAAWNLMSKTFSLDNELLKKYRFSLPASLTITPVSPKNARLIEIFLEERVGHLLKDPMETQGKQKNVTNQMLEFIQNIEDTAQKTLAFFILLFIAGGALLMSSTIHLAIASRHLEINIMKLVGASGSKIAAPFVVEGLILSVSAFVLHLALITILPIVVQNTPLHLNALVAEFAAIIVLGALVSYLTTALHIWEKR